MQEVSYTARDNRPATFETPGELNKKIKIRKDFSGPIPIYSIKTFLIYSLEPVLLTSSPRDSNLCQVYEVLGHEATTSITLVTVLLLIPKNNESLFLLFLMSID